MKPRTPVLVNFVIVVALLLIVYNMFVQNTSFFSSPYFWATVIIAGIMVFIANGIGDLIENNRFQKLSEEEKQAYLEQKKTPYYKRLWASAFKKQTNAEEQDMIIDHGFDGITELDNSLPKWWLGLFYFGTVFCVVYVAAYAFTDYAHPVVEYEKEYKEQLAAIAEYEKTAPKITVETAKYDPANVAEGEALFKTTCLTCHGDGGKGGIGPNLTDDYWINQKEGDVFHNVFWMIENGSPNNPAMRAFIKGGELTGKDAEKIAAYIYHINQEIPPITPAQGGAAPQGTVAPWVKGTPRK
ncbi:c-type cytochrome [Elizabethkingia meningoseptica]|uniref:Cytochrome C n=1 Tax=Elizabethkingia meningoseptica TaxID=238 RepID=A0A1V3TVP8_ELIME|nr:MULTISPECIES: cbb3-type cytochrome c oxidase N-terminal domain-containing protein [Elizabethkingia]AQX11994.1 cytochrome C [Elizabethkingia meningoseptica]EJK5328529.1 c-type cytochrome [Elizabethkingia meningoseptica]MBG0513452.1 c-type cytochrome [Elizabethkingia meningoseptica]MDE5431646.1 c-type cytochrome [Elizabethkingia meningoseptica]MDE5434807.1 c-type cytochrome [Elizabethkingia meningoseptica]